MKVPAGAVPGGEGALAPCLNQSSQISVTDRSLAGAVLAVAGGRRRCDRKLACAQAGSRHERELLGALTEKLAGSGLEPAASGVTGQTSVTMEEPPRLFLRKV
jgi:hypothetical protein